MQRLHVVAAVIRDPSGKVLIAKRHEKLHQGGLWEFPGGKVEHGESVEQALVRELQEELSIRANEFRPLIRIPYDYPDRKVLLDIWRVNDFIGVAHGAEGQEVRWVETGQLHDYRFPAANVPIITAAQLPSRYLITPEPGPRDHWDAFLLGLARSLEAGIELLQLRAKSLEPQEYRELALKVIHLCHQYGSRVLLNTLPQEAESLGADGVHLTSSLLKRLEHRPLSAKQLVSASCHNRDELAQACAIGCDFAVLGPVNETATHPGQEGLGWRAFQLLTEGSSMPVYALGGMTEADMENAWQYGAQGIAAIRALWKGE